MAAERSGELRCSLRTRARGDVPVGSANAAATRVIVETPLPWPPDLGPTDLHRAVAAAAGPGARVHGVVGRPDTPAGMAAVVVHSADPGPFAGYRRRAATVPIGEEAEAVALLLEPPAADPYDRQSPGVVAVPDSDVLVCSHGARDRCCGSFGTNLAARAEHLPPVVWRASHLGGHRFAPTVLVLPSGTTWAWLDDASLEAVVRRTTSPAELIGHYRGSAAVGHPAAQVVEAEAFARVGWEWLDGPRDAVVLGEVDGGGSWEVEVTGADRMWRATVSRVGETPQPVCGVVDLGPKVDPVWTITSLEQSAA